MGAAVVEAYEAVEGIEAVEKEVGRKLLFEGLMVYAHILGLQVLVLDDSLLVLGDVGQQQRDEVGYEGRRAIDDGTDDERVEGRAIDARLHPVGEEREEGGNDQRARQSGGHQSPLAQAYADYPEVIDIEQREEYEVDDDGVAQVEVGPQRIGGGLPGS